jgi:hypothetical protein
MTVVYALVYLVAMNKLTAILDAARTLSHDERHQLIIELDALEAEEHPSVSPSREPLAALRALSGSAHSSFSDISTDKYKHVAAASLDSDD